MNQQKMRQQIIGVLAIIVFVTGCTAPGASNLPSITPVPSKVPSITPYPSKVPSITPDPSLLIQLESSDPIEKALAARQIADTGSYPQGAIEALIACLDDSTRLIPSDKVPMIPPGPYSRDPNETSPGEQCEYALVKIGEPAVDELLAALGNYGEGKHREKIADSLGLIGDPRALTPLINLLDQDSVGLVAVAVARLGGEEASDALLRAYNRVDKAEYFSNLVYALGYSKDKQFLPILLDLLSHPERGVRLNAIIALGHLEDPGAVPALVALLEDEDLHARWYACDALGEIGDPTAIGPLQALLEKETESIVRDAAMDALSQIGD